MNTFQKNFQTFLPYLEEIRIKIFNAVIIFIILFFVGLFSSGFILKYFIATFNIQDVSIVATSPFQFANIAMNIGFFFSAIFTLPILLFQISFFIFPALTKREKRIFLLSIPFSLLLFAIGFVYSFVILYHSFALIAEINQSMGIQNIWDVGNFISQIFITSSLLGLVFQFPIILSILVRMNFIKINFLRQKRRLALFIIAVLVSLLPPTDGISLIVMVVPLIVLYELTILINTNKNLCLD